MQSKKRGLSLEEKKAAVLSIFHETKDVFTLKDVEKLAPKKGVIVQSVKEVLQALVDDSLVHQDKIGISNFFWSFPSEAAVKLRNDQERLQTQLADFKHRSTELSAKLEQERMGKEDSAVRSEKLAALQTLEAELKAMQAEIAQYQDSDPKKLEAMQLSEQSLCAGAGEATGIAKPAANRWLDNIWALQSWCKKRFEGNEASMDTFFKENGLSEDMDYIS